MNLMCTKIFILLVCSALFWIGGKWNHNARRFVMPLVLGLFCAWLSWCWWILMAMAIPMAGFLTLGYGEKSFFYHVFGDGWGRGVWGLLVAVGASLALFLGHAIPWWLFVPYLALNFTLENALKHWNQNIGDPVIGAGFASIVFIIQGVIQ